MNLEKLAQTLYLAQKGTRDGSLSTFVNKRSGNESMDLRKESELNVAGYQTFEGSRIFKVIYRAFGNYAVFIGIYGGSHINDAASIARSIAKRENKIWRKNIRIFCLEPIGLNRHWSDEERHHFEFIEIMYDASDYNYECDYLHTQCPDSIVECFKEFLPKKPVQSCEHICSGRGYVMHRWSNRLRA